MNPDTFNPFEGLNSRAKDKSKNGFTAAEIAESAYRILRLISKDPNHWNQMAEVDREPWLDMAQVAITVFDVREEEELRISVSEWARNLWQLLCQARGIEFPWEELTPLEQFGWHAVVRHVGNLIDSDGPTALPLEEAEEKVVGWARDRIDAGKHFDCLA